MTEVAADNLGFVECWNEILTPKWIRFRHLLSGGGKVHSDIAYADYGIREGDKVLDVGCGWGAFVLHAAREYGVHAVGVTVSVEQAAFARAAVAAAGLALSGGVPLTASAKTLE